MAPVWTKEQYQERKSVIKHIGWRAACRISFPIESIHMGQGDIASL